MAQNRAARRRGEQLPTVRRLSAGSLVAIILTAVIIIGGVVAAIVNAKRVPESASNAPITASIAVGDTAPAVHVTTIDGTNFDSASIHGPMMLEVFATWCPHCQHEVKVIDSLHEQLGSKLAILAASGSPIGMDGSSPGSLSDVQNFASQLGVQYPIAYDQNLGVAKSYLQGGFPTIVFINGDKKIVAIETGEISLAKLKADAKKAGV